MLLKHLKCQRCSYVWYFEGFFDEASCPLCGAQASPKTHVLSGEKAINALEDYVVELERSSSEELTERQTRTIIKLAEALVSAIEGETSALDSLKQWQLTRKLRTLIARVKEKSKTSESSLMQLAEKHVKSNSACSTSPQMIQQKLRRTEGCR